MKSETQNLVNIKKIIYKYCKLNNISTQKTKNIYYLTIAYCYNHRCFFNLLKNTSNAILHYDEKKMNSKLLIQLFNKYYIQNNPMDIFIGFLKEYDAFDSFKRELIIRKNKDINALFLQTYINNWIVEPFYFNIITKECEFWYDLHKKWCSFVEENKYDFFNITNDSYDNYYDYKFEMKNIILNNRYIDNFIFTCLI